MKERETKYFMLEILNMIVTFLRFVNKEKQFMLQGFIIYLDLLLKNS